MVQGARHAAEANLDAHATIGSLEPKVEDSSSFSSPWRCCHSVVSQHCEAAAPGAFPIELLQGRKAVFPQEQNRAAHMPAPHC